MKPSKIFALVLLLFVIILYACLCSGCNVVKKNKSSEIHNVDSSAYKNDDSSSVRRNDSSSSASKDTASEKTTEESTGIKIEIDSSDTVKHYDPISFLFTDSGVTVNTGGRKVKSISTNKTKTIKDSSGSKTTVASHTSNIDSSNKKRNDSSHVLKSDKKDTSSENSFRMPWYVYVIGFVVIGLVIYFWPSRKKANEVIQKTI